MLTQKPTIAIIRSSSIGDVVLASACLDMAKELDVAVTWMGRDPSLDLLRSAYKTLNHNFVDMPKVVRSDVVRSVVNQVGPLKLIVDLQCNARSRVYTKVFGKMGCIVTSVPKRRTERLRLIAKALLRGRLFPKSAYQPTNRPLQYQAMLNCFADGLKKLGMDPLKVEAAQLKARPNLSGLLEKSIVPSWGNDLQFGRWLALAPGAAHATKQCPKQVWIDFLSALRNDWLRAGDSVGLLIVGGDQDRKISVEILDQLSWPWPVLNLVGKLSLSDSAVALSRADLLLTNDSGLLHIAEAVDTPVVAVFGPTVEEFGFAPWKNQSIAVSSQIGCRPCSRHGKLGCRYGDKLCFESIPAAKMKDKSQQIFNMPPRSRTNVIGATS